MTYELAVVAPFEQYGYNARITDPTTIAQIEASPFANRVVRVPVGGAPTPLEPALLLTDIVQIRRDGSIRVVDVADIAAAIIILALGTSATRDVGTNAGQVAAGDDARIVNALDRRILALAADPQPTDIPAGTIRVAKNTATGRLSVWANDGGTMVDLLTLATA